jgi:hypothetical protein
MSPSRTGSVSGVEWMDASGVGRTEGRWRKKRVERHDMFWWQSLLLLSEAL